jgi:hypothetical protein
MPKKKASPLQELKREQRQQLGGEYVRPKGRKKELAASDLRRFVAVTDQPNRNGHAVTPQKMDVESFEANPVFLFGHNDGTGFGETPEVENILGAVEEIEKFDDRIEIGVRFAEHPRAQIARDLVDQGMLNAVSIGFMPDFDDTRIETVEGEPIVIFGAAELWEISLVPVPADPNALRIVQSAMGSGVTPKEENDMAGKPTSDKKKDQRSKGTAPKEEATVEDDEKDDEQDAPDNVVRLNADDEAEVARKAEERAKKEEQKRVKGIRQLCQLAGKAELALDYIAEGKSLEDVQQALVDDLADDDEDDKEPTGRQPKEAAGESEQSQRLQPHGKDGVYQRWSRRSKSA